jgi:RNA polymerase sigma factor (TIGR02999 family)
MLEKGMKAVEHNNEDKRLTSVLSACRRGDGEAFDQLMSFVYKDLCRIAHWQLERRRWGQTLNTTSLVHEVYLKLVHQSKVSWHDKEYFFAIAARAMRQIIVDYAKRKRAQKRGGFMLHQTLEEVEPVVEDQAEKIVALDQALNGLAALDQRLIRVVECRYFAGYTVEETASALTVSSKTVQRDWIRARAWLREMGWSSSV